MDLVSLVNFELRKLTVWNKAFMIPGQDPRKVRKDSCGAIIAFDHYGNRDSNFGWEIDHIKPVKLGGVDNFDNLRPLHWENNAATGAKGFLVCAVRAY